MFQNLFIPLSPCPLFQQWLCGKAASGLERILCRLLVKKLLESMDLCTGPHDITEILLKTALNTIQSINHSNFEKKKGKYFVESIFLQLE